MSQITQSWEKKIKNIKFKIIKPLLVWIKFIYYILIYMFWEEYILGRISFWLQY